MAGELQAYAQTGLTLYAQVTNLIGQIYNTVAAAFQSYATANIANYDFPMTEQGTASGLYLANFPTVAAGMYNYRVLKRVGGSPAETDPILFLGEVNWDGSAAVAPGISVSQIMAGGDIDGYTLEQCQKLMLAILSGELTGAGAQQVTIRAADNSKVRITADVDSLGNRSNVVKDATG